MGRAGPQPIDLALDDAVSSSDLVQDRRRYARRVAGWAATGFILLQFAWMLVMPPATGIDEFDHLYRASAVAMGHWAPPSHRPPQALARGGYLKVRADIVSASGPACARLRYTRPFNCRPYRQLGGGVVEVASGVERYNPLFYAVVGTIARPFTGDAATYVMRGASMTLCAAAFGLAVYLAGCWSRTRWPIMLVLLAALPTTVYSTSIAAPNGLNMLSGLVVWVALATLIRGHPWLRTAGYASLMGGVAVLATTHTLGLVWIGLIAVTASAYHGPRTAARLLRPRTRAELVAVAVAVAAVTFELWWLWFARPNDPTLPEGGQAGSPWHDIAVAIVIWPLQAIGAFPLRNEAAPVGLYAFTLAVLVSVAIIAVRALRRDAGLTRMMVVTAFWTVVVPVALTYITYHDFGTSWQGRYGMPYSVGLFVIAAMALDAHPPRIGSTLPLVGVAMWGAAHAIGLVGVLAEQRSDHRLVLATGWWAPPVLMIIGLAALATFAWLRALRVPIAVTEPG